MGLANRMSLDTQLAQLENAQLVRPLFEIEREYIFKHAPTQETAYQSLLHKTRRGLHRQVETPTVRATWMSGQEG